MTLIIQKEKAPQLYRESQPWFQELLVKEFGEDFFLPRDYTSIKTFEDACDMLGLDPNNVAGAFDSPDEVAYKKLKVVARAINQDWHPDWSDSDQSKWWPWFVLSSGFDFSDSDSDYPTSYTNVGSHLCFENRAKCDYAGRQFIDLYKQLLT